VLSDDVLYFLSNKFVNTSVKVLKSTLVDFYDVEDVKVISCSQVW